MSDTNVDIQLLELGRKHLSSLDVAEPYVWRLNLSAETFNELQNLIFKSIDANGGDVSHLLTPEYALIVIVYIAEWYKREYRAGARNRLLQLLDSEDLRRLWEASCIAIPTYVYQTDGGNHLWQYSIFVLGGLAVRHELHRPDSMRYIKMLCRIYNGEDPNVENIGGEDRAIAFRESIRRHQSLYHYFQALITGSLDVNDPVTGQLVAVIKSAYDEVRRSKFRLEWIVSKSQTSYFSRKLRLWLKPEDVNLGNHQYLDEERLAIWNIPDMKSRQNIYFGVRFRRGHLIVKDVDSRKPVITFAQSGDGHSFLAWGIENYATLSDIPVEDFTHVDIVAFDGAELNLTVQTEEAGEWMQLWRTDSHGNDWSSVSSPQHQTAVIYKEPATASLEPDEVRPFRNAAREGTLWNWNFINTEIVITNAQGKELTLYNRIGYDRVYARLYPHTLRYIDGELVSVISEDDEGEFEETLPVIFSREDIMAYHFETSDTGREAEGSIATVAEDVEYKEKGRYIPWDYESQQPAYGIVALRVTIKGRQILQRMIFLPGPIVRDLDTNEIRYRDINGTPMTFNDNIPLDYKPLKPTVMIEVGYPETGMAQLEVYRPTRIKEIYIDGNVTSYNTGQERTCLPYIFKWRTRIADFGEHGYSQYDCRELGRISEVLPETNYALSGAWRDGKVWPATALDSFAPGWLDICIGQNNETGGTGDENLRFYLWDFAKPDEAPVAVPYSHDIPAKGSTVLFEDMSQANRSLTCLEAKMSQPSPFKGGKVTPDMILPSFLVASRYQVYFESFRPLAVRHTAEEIKAHLIEPLKEMNGGELTAEIIENLMRLADEFNLDPSAWKE